MRKNDQGFALLIAVIFTSVMLAFALLFGSLGYKQAILSNVARDSQYAFYAADSGLECLLLADNSHAFDYDKNGAGITPSVSCGGATPVSTGYLYDSPPNALTYQGRFDFGSYCADITIYKPKDGTGQTTYLFSQGYSTTCANVGSASARYAARGLKAKYK